MPEAHSTAPSSDPSAWCGQTEIETPTNFQPLHATTYIEGLHQSHERAMGKLYLTAQRDQVSWLSIGGFLSINPATSVKAPVLVMTRGKPPGARRRGSP